MTRATTSILMRFGDFALVESAGLQLFERAEVVDVDFAVDFGGVELGPAFP